MICRIDIYAIPREDGVGTLVGHIWPDEGWDAEAFPLNDEEQKELWASIKNEYPHPIIQGGLLYVGVFA